MTTETIQTGPTNDPKQHQRFVSQDEDGLRVDRWFKRHFPQVTNGQIQKWLRTGKIRVNGSRSTASNRLSQGQAIRIPPPLTASGPLTKKLDGVHRHPMRHAEKMKKWVLYEDNDVIALNKPPGLAVQGGTGLKENLDDSLMIFSLDGITRPKLVHRLDRDTSGVLLIARNDFAATKLAASFRSHNTHKIYWAVTLGIPKPSQGHINLPLVKLGQTMHVTSKSDDEKSKKALTLYRVVEAINKKLAFVALWPKTGRTHQLRVHLAAVGTPIWGDPIYGHNNGLTTDKEAFTNLGLGSGLHLHARRLIIPHPRNGLIDVTAPLSPQMSKTWEALGFTQTIETPFDDE